MVYRDPDPCFLLVMPSRWISQKVEKAPLKNIISSRSIWAEGGGGAKRRKVCVGERERERERERHTHTHTHTYIHPHPPTLSPVPTYPYFVSTHP